ncbi:uncharacterized protein LOC107431904 isoform X3 [Ziziphus jujuba]|uniref:RING-type E3 ubiquitin transferase n=1 Tax=Ziziphus jujuba TaxID=326968 RepID=A0A6P4BH76_ZIZJJ|nr:uncharacterized protein LOC107431904 isoform X3 [Ziziphus jujuba]
MANPHRLHLEFIQNDQLYGAVEQVIDVQDEDDEEEGEAEEEEDDDGEEEEEEEEEDEHQVADEEPVRVSHGEAAAFENGVEEAGEKRRRIDSGDEALLWGGVGSVPGSSQGNECKWSEIDGLFCPICMEAWTSDGVHHICCLPCGHIYGMSCIKRWLQQRRNSGKCPQCNRKCTLKDVRKLFAPRIVALDEESQKRIRSLEAKCASLKKKEVGWGKKEAEWKKREAELHLKVKQLTEQRTTYLEHLVADRQSRPSESSNIRRDFQGRSVHGNQIQASSKFCRQESSCNFKLQKDMQVDGACLFDIDAANQLLLIARSLSGVGVSHVLTKMSMIPPYEREDILLPSATNLIKDLHISPFNSSLALLASLGKKLSVISMESNNVILAYDLPVAAWTCSWDLNSSHYIYVGLQNGSVMVFDMRQTTGPMNSLRGLTSNPVHTLHSLLHNSTPPSGSRSVLSASSVGLCQWNFDGSDEGPSFVHGMENQGVCISLAYCPSSDDIVASYRPKVEMSNEMALTQPSLTQSRVPGQGVVGSHVHLKRVGSSNFQKLSSIYANVNDIRLPKSAIIDIEDRSQLFASSNEATSELLLQELPSFTVCQRLKSERHPLRDMKYTHALSQCLLGCLCDDTLQIFNTQPS